MSIAYRQADFEKETQSFEAFDQLTTGLTLIDKYQSSEYKDEVLLDQAATSIEEALKADKNYFKAQYFKAVVKYLQGAKDAINYFDSLFESNPASNVRNEILYNIAVINSKAGNFPAAIEGFQSVIKGATDPEINLLARAGLALTCAKRIKDPEYRNAKEIQARDREEIKIQWLEIKKIVASTRAETVREEVVNEIRQIMDWALNENVKLPGRWRQKLAQIFRKKIILIPAIIILVLLILYLFMYYGLHKI